MGTQAVSSNNRRTKAAKSALVVALALLLALGGTFAWMQVTRAATNEFTEYSNPGGRLHDDFTWTSADKDKDVYVENFTSGDEGENIYVRVQLREYLEAGSTSYPTGATASDHSKWETHLYRDGTHEAATGDFHKYFDFTYGGQTAYMPTFNKNKDSLDPDVNGSYRDPGGPFTSYKDYSALVAGGSYSEKRDAYYDADANDVDERVEGSLTVPGAGGAENENYVAKEETHSVKQTLDAEVIPMSTWSGYTTDADKAKACWVYDTDGWAYWSQALKPGEATGLLLNNVARTGNTIAGDWYYAIDAIGEFATSDAWYKDGADSYYFGRKGGEGHAMTQSAYNLLNNAADRVGEAPAGMPAWVNEVKAASIANVAAEAAGGDASAAVVNIEGTDYVKLAQTDKGDQALLMRKYLLPDPRAFGSTNSWASSDLRSYLNNEYAASLPVGLRNRLVQVDIETKEQVGVSNFIATQDKVFLLTEADVFGETSENGKSLDQHYFTYGAKSLVPGSLRIAMVGSESGSAESWWLRSPRLGNGKNVVAVVHASALASNSTYSTPRYVRPAFWINLDS